MVAPLSAQQGSRGIGVSHSLHEVSLEENSAGEKHSHGIDGNSLQMQKTMTQGH